MIRKAQIRFICITTSIILVFLTVFFGISQFFLIKSNNRAIAFILNEIEKTESPKTNEIIITVHDHDHFEVIPADNSFSENTVLSLVSSVLRDTENGYEKHVYYSRLENIYYKVNNQSGQITITASDMTETVKELNSNTFTLLLFFAVIFVVLVLIVWLSSYKVFQPIKESFYNQKRFISDASHELKTPVAVISANTDVLKNTCDDNKYLKSIKNQTERLSLLVSDMLTLSRLEESEEKIAKSEFSLTNEVIETVLPFEAMAFEKGKILLTEIPEGINYFGNKESVGKLLNILLDNALKYSLKGGTVKVTLKKDGNKPTISVFNSGSDIADSDSDRVFERFYRGDSSRSRETGGSGLGLSIAKSIAIRNKWKISANSVKDVSMTITITM